MNILGTKYDNLTFDTALDRAISMLKKPGKSSLFFLNSDGVYKAQKDKEYADIINSADIVLPDGVGLKLITRLFGGRMKADCNGTDFSPVFLERAAREGYKIFFLGSKEGVSGKAANNTRNRIAGIKIVGTNTGYFKGDASVIDRINNSGADILFVAMGVPLQEKWIARNRERLNPRLCLGVGALFDYLSGRIPRAPLVMRKFHLEWLWRIFIEPGRMFKRYIIDGMRLFVIVVKYKITGSN